MATTIASVKSSPTRATLAFAAYTRDVLVLGYVVVAVVLAVILVTACEKREPPPPRGGTVTARRSQKASRTSPDDADHVAVTAAPAASYVPHMQRPSFIVALAFAPLAVACSSSRAG